MKKILLSLLALIGFGLATPALAQSTCPSIVYGAVLSAGQWQSCFQAKNDFLNYTPLNRAGGSMTGVLSLVAPGTRGSLQFNLGTASSPSTGDFWLSSSGINFKLASSTVGPINTSLYTGVSAPTAPAYSIWNDTSAATIPVKMYDGSQWVVLGTLTPATHSWSSSGGGGNAFFAVAGPATTVKTYTFPNTTSNVFTDTAGSFTSSQLLGAISDETGTGSAVFATSAVINPTSIGATTAGTGKFTTLQATSTVTTAITGSTQCVQANSSGVLSGTGATCSAAPIANRQVFTTVASGTFTTTTGARQLFVRMCGGGGGGSGWNGSSVGGTGGTTSFGSTTATGGSGGSGGSTSAIGLGGAGGGGGSNTGATQPFRSGGSRGADGTLSGNGTFSGPGGMGGAGVLGGPGTYCAGGMGGGTAATAGNGSGGGGGSGDYVEFYVNAPGATIAYTVGAGGTASTGGSINGTAGGQGVLIVEERF